LLFGGDIYGMFAGQSFQTEHDPNAALAQLSNSGKVHIAYCTS